MTARLDLGLAALGRPGYVTLNHASDLGGHYDPQIMELHAHDVLSAAFEAGMRYIDAARSYGRAEDFVASWLRKRAIEPGEISVASKWGYTYTAGWSPSATQHEVKDVDTTQLDGAFAHRVFDDSLLADLPIGVGPCGERGEFHTFVSDSPGYDGPVENMVGETVLRDERFAYGDLIPTTRPQPPAGPP